ncbi:hypothetical protein, conserved [Eimeria tenella]|uniref:Uncharacterized protein n=1 Tax=Eimeria tenella TaxID=5802 RepID=U6KJ10_EIMTE|nr:hypothetical protein, conserved [Eimeria tenella]CDJ37894.1 hypothetical protein, conserved [Eimeria tenella]|eukprot:XP_013228732.1 hypothetical protein, conserved [Eimeria tenella]
MWAQKELSRTSLVGETAENGSVALRSPRAQGSGVCTPRSEANLNANFVQGQFKGQFISFGDFVDFSAHSQGGGPWGAPTFQHSFQSSKPNVRITVTHKQGAPIQYLFSSNGKGGIQQIRGPPKGL